MSSKDKVVREALTDGAVSFDVIAETADCPKIVKLAKHQAKLHRAALAALDEPDEGPATDHIEAMLSAVSDPVVAAGLSPYVVADMARKALDAIRSTRPDEGRQGLSEEEPAELNDVGLPVGWSLSGGFHYKHESSPLMFTESQMNAIVANFMPSARISQPRGLSEERERHVTDILHRKLKLVRKGIEAEAESIWFRANGYRDGQRVEVKAGDLRKHAARLRQIAGGGKL